MNRLALAFGMAALTATTSPSAAAEGTRLTGDALASTISGKMFTGKTSRGGTWEATYAPDGRFSLRVLNSDWSDTGTWEIKDDRLCSERTKRKYMCYQVMRVSDDELHWIDERRQTTKSSGPK